MIKKKIANTPKQESMPAVTICFAFSHLNSEL